MWGRTASELAAGLRDGTFSAREVMAAHLARIEAVNPHVNAIVTLVDPEQALAAADAADRARARGEPHGVLRGLPLAVKDLEETAGLRTTYGSPLFAEHVPAADSLMVARLKSAGGIIIGKTNTPEFGAGSQTFNRVFGATRNPYDLARTPGGSSGGAAAAVAAGMVPVADGSDLGASVRNPAAFCNLVSLRPTAGRIPDPGPGDLWNPLAVLGPIGRSVDDLALFLQAVAGPDPRDPLSLQDPPATFAADLRADPRGLRIAWSRDLGGLPVDPEITRVLEAQRATLERSAAWSRTPSPTSPAPTRRSRRCVRSGTPAWHRSSTTSSPTWRRTSASGCGSPARRSPAGSPCARRSSSGWRRSSSATTRWPRR